MLAAMNGSRRIHYVSVFAAQLAAGEQKLPIHAGYATLNSRLPLLAADWHERRATGGAEF
jgi:hypothetical protein